VADDSGRRLIFFGQHAGFAGMIDALWALGQRLRIDGHETPLAEVMPAYRYEGLPAAKAALRDIGERIADVGLPAEIVPLVCGFTGTGNVSAGAQEILHLLPVVDVAPADLAGLSQDPNVRSDAIYKTVFDLDERFVRRGGGAVTLDELSAHPERFENGMPRYLGHVDLLVNGMFWVSALPRLLTLHDLTAGWSSGELQDLRVIADIACDIDGAIEATVKATTPDNPVYVYDVEGRRVVDGLEGSGPVILAVDNLPAELPREASQDFGDTLIDFVPRLDGCDWTRPFKSLELPAELSRAIIAHRSSLAPQFEHLREFLDEDGA
jgi:alpha-aminoadipic semialdehyde synthase